MEDLLRIALVRQYPHPRRIGGDADMTPRSALTQAYVALLTVSDRLPADLFAGELPLPAVA